MACEYPTASNILDEAGDDYSLARIFLFSYVEGASRMVRSYLFHINALDETSLQITTNGWNLESTIAHDLIPTFEREDAESCCFDEYREDGAWMHSSFSGCEWIFGPSYTDQIDTDGDGRGDITSTNGIGGEFTAEQVRELICWLESMLVVYESILSDIWSADPEADEAEWTDYANRWDGLLHLTPENANYFRDCLRDAGCVADWPRTSSICGSLVEATDTVDVGEIDLLESGCTDPEALNYNPEATKDCLGFPLSSFTSTNTSCCIYPGDGPSVGSDEAVGVPKGVSTEKCEDPSAAAPLIETYQSCFPNPQAVPPNWIDQPEGEPFLNEKTCEYSIVIFADPPDCSEEYLNSFIDPAVSNLLSYYNKDPNTVFVNPSNFNEIERSSLDALTSGVDKDYYRDGLQFFGSAKVKDFYIPPRLLAKTKILVTVGAEEFNRIPEREENLFGDAPVGTEATPSYVVFATSDITRIFDVVARSFRFFEVPYVEWTLENGKTIKGLNFVKEADKIERFYNLLKSLVEKSYDSIFSLETIRINFDSEYKIESVMATGPYDFPIKLEKGFENFLEKPLPNNQTLMAYISRLPDMRDDLVARMPLSWYDLLEKYRYPEMEETYISDVTSPVGEEFSGLLALSEAACPAGSSAFEPKKTPGQWLGAEANSIAQALLNKLQENPCAIVDARILEAQNRSSVVMEVTDLTLKEYLSSDRIINDLPVMMVNNMFEKGSNWSDIGRLYQSMLDNLGYCGWLDLIKEALDCVLNALGYEDSISLIVGAAVRGMTVSYTHLTLPTTPYV